MLDELKREVSFALSNPWPRAAEVFLRVHGPTLEAAVEGMDIVLRMEDETRGYADLVESYQAAVKAYRAAKAANGEG